METLESYLQEKLGIWEKVQWLRSRTGHSRYIILEIPYIIATKLRCHCSDYSPGDITGFEAVMDDSRPVNYSCKVVVYATGQVHHQRCGKIVASIAKVKVD